MRKIGRLLMNLIGNFFHVVLLFSLFLASCKPRGEHSLGLKSWQEVVDISSAAEILKGVIGEESNEIIGSYSVSSGFRGERVVFRIEGGIVDFEAYKKIEYFLVSSDSQLFWELVPDDRDILCAMKVRWAEVDGLGLVELEKPLDKTLEGRSESGSCDVERGCGSGESGCDDGNLCF